MRQRRHDRGDGCLGAPCASCAGLSPPWSKLWGQEGWKWRLRAVSSAGHVNLPRIGHRGLRIVVREPSQLSSWPLTPAQGAGSTFELQPRAQPVVDRSCPFGPRQPPEFSRARRPYGTGTLMRGRSNTLFLGTVAKRAACASSSFAASIARRQTRRVGCVEAAWHERRHLTNPPTSAAVRTSER